MLYQAQADRHVNTDECRARLGYDEAETARKLYERRTGDQLNALLLKAWGPKVKADTLTERPGHGDGYVDLHFPDLNKVYMDPLTAGTQMTLNCPTCNRPLAEKGDPGSEYEFSENEVILEFIRVMQSGVQNEEDRYKRLAKKFRFVRREAPAEPERED